LWKGVAFLAEGVVKFLADEALAGRRTSKSFENFLGSLVILAVMSSSAIGLVLGGLSLFAAYMDDFAGGAAAASMEEYDEAKKRMCITRKTSVEAPPTPDELRRAWEAARGRGSLTAKLLAGTLLSNLEPAVDQSYLRAEDGTIVGRRPGLKGWLRANCPELLPHYKALMSYKALADKLRVALGVEEPDTLSGVLDFGGAHPPETLRFRERFRLSKTDEAAVREGIRAMFGDASAHGTAAGNMSAKTSVEGHESKGEADAKTSVNGARERGEKEEGTTPARGAKGEMAPITTMGALEAVVRKRLGLCWMRRTGRTRRAA
jgi:hypothetical protein